VEKRIRTGLVPIIPVTQEVEIKKIVVGGEMTQTLYAHMNKKKKKKNSCSGYSLES
jgi:hypothetical protein